MAARRVAVSSLDWAEFATKIPAAQKPAFAALKNKQDKFVRTIAALPAELPKIDFANYKEKIAVANMVSDFEKQYGSLAVPYPKDTMTTAIEGQAVTEKKNFEKYVAESKNRMTGFATETAKWEAMKCPSLMTKEELMDDCPHLLDFHPDVPSYWPHDRKLEDWEKMMEEMEEEHH